MTKRTLRKRYDFPPVQTSGEKVTQTIELDKGTERVIGLMLCSDRDDMLFHRGTFSMNLSNQEVIPEDYHAKLLMSGLGVAPEKRYLPVNMQSGNGVIKAVYQDSASPVQPFGAPYTVSLYLETETPLV